MVREWLKGVLGVKEKGELFRCERHATLVSHQYLIKNGKVRKCGCYRIVQSRWESIPEILVLWVREGK